MFGFVTSEIGQNSRQLHVSELLGIDDCKGNTVVPDWPLALRNEKNSPHNFTYLVTY